MYALPISGFKGLDMCLIIAQVWIATFVLLHVIWDGFEYMP
jgi:hypothetical protein